MVALASNQDLKIYFLLHNLIGSVCQIIYLIDIIAQQITYSCYLTVFMM